MLCAALHFVPDIALRSVAARSSGLRFAAPGPAPRWWLGRLELMEHRCAPTHNARRDCTYPAPGTGAGLPDRRSPACAARLHTRMFAALRQRLPLAARGIMAAALVLRSRHHALDVIHFYVRMKPMEGSKWGGRIIPLNLEDNTAWACVLLLAGAGGTCFAALHTFPAKGGDWGDTGLS